MVDKERLLRRLLATFVDELEDQVAIIRARLDDADSEETSIESARALLRAVHSLKGAARSVNQPDIERLCHLLEDRLVALDIDAELAALLRDAADALSAAAGRLRTEGQGARMDDLVAPFLGFSASAPPLAPVAPRAAAVVPAAAVRAHVREAARRPVGLSLGDVAPIPVPPVLLGTTRLASGSLDALVAESGEVMVAQRRLERGESDMAAVGDALRDLERLLRELHASVGVVSREHPTAVVARRLGQGVRRAQRALDRVESDYTENRRRLSALTDSMHDRLLGLRMVPFALACEGLDRVVRDLAASTAREAVLRLEGASVEVDRMVLESLQDALRHLARNAVDHGIEGPAERMAAGKPATATVTVSARLRGGTVEIRVADDGRGIDRDAIRRRLAERGVEGDMPDAMVDNVIFQPGFTTRRDVGALSGRGVGLDAVRERVVALNGSISVNSVPGKGTAFDLAVPVTLSRVEALLVRAWPGQAIYAIASGAVERVARVGADGLQDISVLPLADIVSPAGDAPTHGVAVVVRGAGERVAFVVAELLGAVVLVLQTLGRRLRRTPLVTAASYLPEGGIAPVLNPDGLVRVGLGMAGLPETIPTSVRRRVLVAEDSATTRRLVTGILEDAGYDVGIARDGVEAWARLQVEMFDAVISDVDMPGLDGLQLAERIRDSARPLPVILLTSRALADDVHRGLRAGARAYLPKASFDAATLLASLARLL